MPVIYHITTPAQWDEAQQKGYYDVPSLKEEGFIHCSIEDQLKGVLERYYTGKSGLVKLVIDTELLTSPLYYDWSPSISDTFPHIYGAINLDAVKDVLPVG